MTLQKDLRHLKKDMENIKVDSLEEAKKGLDKKEARIDALNEENKKLQTKISTFQDEVSKEAQGLAELYKQAEKHIKSDEILSKLSTMSASDIKRAIIGDSLEGKSTEYVDAYFDAVISTKKTQDMVTGKKDSQPTVHDPFFKRVGDNYKIKTA